MRCEEGCSFPTREGSGELAVSDSFCVNVKCLGALLALF